MVGEADEAAVTALPRQLGIYWPQAYKRTLIHNYSSWAHGVDMRLYGCILLDGVVFTLSTDGRRKSVEPGVVQLAIFQRVCKMLTS
jgi:hypothetical protein